MVEISKKIIAIIAVISSVVTAIALAVAFNLGGLGDALAGAGGPVAKGFYEIAAAPLLWGSSGGWPTLIAVYIGLIALCFGFAYVIWHFDIPYKIVGGGAQDAGVYQSAPQQNTIPLTGLQEAPSNQKEAKNE